MGNIDVISIYRYHCEENIEYRYDIDIDISKYRHP